MSTALITGAAGGIGYELARQLAARGTAVIAVCRKPGAELPLLPVRVEADIDIATDAGCTALATRVAGVPLDLLIHNAGVLFDESLDALDEEAVVNIRRQFEVNALAPLRLTARLAPQLVRGGKLVLITSRMGSMADNNSGGYYGYRMSKAAMNAAGRSLAHDLAPRGVAVVMLHPGFVQTPMTGGRGDVDPATAARGLIARIDELTPASSGRFLHANGSPLPW
ncbi:MAG: SDR family oxidoreductase [Gammaproteobacteria bacterium]|nr:SDR family oxidoreductase [Gammaproteobacteria bacterium]MDH5274575.1 SDR family oxidoreductase [Gammaproteobacteria bacterium]